MKVSIRQPLQLFVCSMGKLLPVVCITDSITGADEIRAKDSDLVTVASAGDPKSQYLLHFIANSYSPDHTPSLAGGIPDLVKRTIEELDCFVHCLMIDSQLDPQRRGQLREINPLVQDARKLCFPGANYSREVAEVRHSYMTENCQALLANLCEDLLGMESVARHSGTGDTAKADLERLAWLANECLRKIRIYSPELPPSPEITRDELHVALRQMVEAYGILHDKLSDYLESTADAPTRVRKKDLGRQLASCHGAIAYATHLLDPVRDPAAAPPPGIQTDPPSDLIRTLAAMHLHGERYDEHGNRIPDSDTATTAYPYQQDPEDAIATLTSLIQQARSLQPA